MNVSITKFLASARGKRFVRQAHEMVIKQRERELNITNLARITNRAHPDYINGIPYAK